MLYKRENRSNKLNENIKFTVQSVNNLNKKKVEVKIKSNWFGFHLVCVIVWIVWIVSFIEIYTHIYRLKV